MNANELANELLNNVEAEYFESGGDIWADITDESWKIIQDAAIMLRTIPALEAEIEGLKATLKKIEDLKSGAYKDLLSDINSRTYIRGL